MNNLQEAQENLKLNDNKFQGVRKNLCVVTQYFPPDFAPTGQLIHELVSYLGNQGDSIKVFSGQPGYAYKNSESTAPPIEYQEGVHIRRTRASQLFPARIRGKLVNGLLFFFRAALHGLRHYKKDKDVILLTTAPAFLPVLGYIFNLCLGVPYVCLIYDLYPDVAVELGVVSSKHGLVKFWNFVNGLVWHKAHRVIVLSDSMKKRVIATHPKLETKISVIHTWCNPEQIFPREKANNWFAHEHKLLKKFTVMYSGNMGRCHDMTTIMEAAYQLRNEQIQFIFIGDGAERQTCLDLVEKWDLKNCLFLPYQDRETLPYSLTACDLSLVSIKAGMESVVAPSKFYGLLASGRPVAAICNLDSYLSKMIADANCGQSFDNGNSYGLSTFIKSLASDSQLAQTMGQAGRSYLLLNFTLPIIAEQYLQVLELAQNKVNISREDYQIKLVGQILQEVGLLSATQVEEILQDQKNTHPHWRFGEIVVYKGLLKQETMDFVLNSTKLATQALQKGLLNQEALNFILKGSNQV